MKKLKDYQIVSLVVFSILLNYLGRYTAGALNLPLWLDSVGTILVAYYLGPVCGAVAGAAVNIVYGFQSSVHFAYIPVSIVTGVVAGLASERGRFSNYFEVSTVASMIAIISTVISTPLNYFFNNGSTGNDWGDGIIKLLEGWNFPPGICYLVGEFYLDFLDKILSTLLVFAAVTYIRRRLPHGLKRKLKLKESVSSLLLACMLVNCVGSTAVSAAIPDDDDNISYNSYVQNVYGGMSGLLGGAANDITSTKDGLLWIGTYGGLYRYNGTEFKRMNNLDSIKNVNCLFVDDEGRMWVGTNDDGLSICINQQVANVIDEGVGLPSNSVRSIAFSSDGFYYVGTSDSLCVITLSSGIKIHRIISDIKYAKRIATDSNKNAVAVTDAGDIFLLRNGEIVDRLSHSGGYVYTACAFDESGRLYVGTSSNVVEYLSIRDNKLVREGSLTCDGIKQINTLRYDDSGRIFVCSDFGVGYIRKNQFHHINTNSFNSQIDNMTVDYQGNLWFTSSRQGLLRMCQTPFLELYNEAGLEPKVVNSVAKWNNKIYFGTDSGLDVIDAVTRAKLSESLCSLLDKVRIRCLLVDTKNRLWICTSGNGVYEVRSDGSYRVYTADDGMLGNKQRSCLQLSDGSMAVAGDAGISFIRDGQVIKTVGKKQGLTNTKILTMAEMESGKLAAGSDGAGIFIIENYQVVSNIKRENGLSSNIILRIVKMDDGLVVATTSSLCHIDSYVGVTKIRNFPYNNNFDIIERNDKVWVLGGAGIYIVDKASLLSNDLRNYDFLDSRKGLRGAITANAWNYVDADGNLYVSCDSGVNVIDMNHYTAGRRSYRMSVKSISVDGVPQKLTIGDVANIPRGASRLEIYPEIINYSINNPYFMYYLDGYDTEYHVVPQNELTSVTYTNLPSKTYTFHLAIAEEKNGKVIGRLSYVINKEMDIQDHYWFLMYAALVFVLAVVWVTWFIMRTQVQKTLNMQRRELALVKRQLEMGNETVMAIARTLDAKDGNTSQHASRVADYSVLIARKLGFTDEQCENLRKTALLHDIGKIGIPDSVLNKPGKLTDEEYEVMKSHVVLGGDILKDFSLIDGVSEGALYHHERYDGRGYVHGLKGEEIPLNARIIGIADAFDAMTANRVYRKQVDFAFVIEEIKKGRGTQFDPQMVDIMLELIESGHIDIQSIYGEATE
ncbi:MAG: two-component regulator propeller domain-containing protein [Selenomonadaceae bacterium]|nr:two-component regulator propeller domain-containing protein [Selenomonadaceae bacterium]